MLIAALYRAGYRPACPRLNSCGRAHKRTLLPLAFCVFRARSVRLGAVIEALAKTPMHTHRAGYQQRLGQGEHHTSPWLARPTRHELPRPFGGRVWCCVSWGVDQAIGVNGNGARAIVNPRAWTAPLHGEARR